MDADGRIYDHFRVTAQPAFVIIDRAGNATTLRGALDEDELDAALTDATA